MNNRFANAMKHQRTQEKINTDNGALAYKTSGKNLLDLNFKVPELRLMPELDLKLCWHQVYDEDPVLALRWLFYLRDVRGGLGERRAFHVMFKDLDPALRVKLISHRVIVDTPDSSESVPIIPHYGRWKDLFGYYAKSPKNVQAAIFAAAKFQLGLDLKRMSEGKSISFMGKYLPSISASNAERRHNARLFAKYLGVDQRDYQEMVSALLEYLHVPEQAMSRGDWGLIDFQRVPSAAMRLYNKAFRRHDQERFEKYLEDVKSGKAKIHSATLYPYQIFSEARAIVSKLRYGDELTESELKNLEVLEAQWKALPAFVDKDRSVLFVLDGSGSMFSPAIPNSRTYMWDVAASLTIKGSETLKGPFKDTFITFSHNPRIVDMSGCKTLEEKIRLLLKYDDVANTDVEKTMMMILKIALDNDLKQEDLPTDIVITSDMQFDAARGAGYCYGGYNPDYWARKDESEEALFESIIAKFKVHGYVMPRITFWNVSHMNKTIPLQKSPGGVTLVSGFSINNYKIIVNGQLDPFEALKTTLMDSRYDPVEDAYNEYLKESGKAPVQKKTNKRRPTNYKRAVSRVLNTIKEGE